MKDTLKYVKCHGVERRLAEAHAELIDEASRDDHATNLDIDELRLAMKADFSELRTAMYRAMMLQATVIVGANVALIKLLP